MSLSNGSSDDEMPPSFPAEGSHGGSIRKVTHTQCTPKKTPQPLSIYCRLNERHGLRKLLCLYLRILGISNKNMKDLLWCEDVYWKKKKKELMVSLPSTFCLPCHNIRFSLDDYPNRNNSWYYGFRFHCKFVCAFGYILWIVSAGMWKEHL